MGNNIRLLIVDDHAVVRQGLRMLLTQRYGIDVIAEAGDGATAVALAAELQPDVILMDLVMPGMGGLEAITAIRTAQPRSRIVVLTSLGSESHMAAAVRSGAAGFVSKDSTPDDLVSAIHSVNRGQLAIPAQLMVALAGSTPQGGTAGDKTVLSGRELDVLREVAHGRSNEEIAEALSISVNTVRSHVRKILIKLELENRTQAAIYAYECGLLIPGAS